MTFEETVAFFEGHVGKTVEVAVQVPVPERPEPVHIAGYMAVIGSVRRGGPSLGPEAWYVWMARGEDSLSASIYLDSVLFEDADVEADTPPANERGETGMTWTMVIRQAGVIIDIVFYV